MQINVITDHSSAKYYWMVLQLTVVVMIGYKIVNVINNIDLTTNNIIDVKENFRENERPQEN